MSVLYVFKVVELAHHLIHVLLVTQASLTMEMVLAHTAATSLAIMDTMLIVLETAHNAILLARHAVVDESLTVSLASVVQHSQMEFALPIVILIHFSIVTQVHVNFVALYSTTVHLVLKQLVLLAQLTIHCLLDHVECHVLMVPLWQVVSAWLALHFVISAPVQLYVLSVL